MYTKTVSDVCVQYEIREYPKGVRRSALERRLLVRELFWVKRCWSKVIPKKGQIYRPYKSTDSPAILAQRVSQRL